MEGCLVLAGSFETWQFGDHDLCQSPRSEIPVRRPGTSSACDWGRSRVLGQGGTVIYGLYGFTHGWARVLTVMSPQGAASALGIIDAGGDVESTAGEGRLTQYIEKREGALARLVEANGIIVLTKRDWDARKRELGDCIW